MLNYYILICRCMQKRVQHNKRRADAVVSKNIALTLFETVRKGYERYYLWEVSWILNRTATYWPPNSSGYSSISFPFSWADQPGAWRHGSHSPFLQLIWLPVAPGLYNCLTSNCLLWASHLHSIQPVDSQGYPPISSTRCTCYLHRGISHLTTRPGRRSICYKITW